LAASLREWLAEPPLGSPRHVSSRLRGALRAPARLRFISLRKAAKPFTE
jgi:hypothetical protein